MFDVDNIVQQIISDLNGGTQKRSALKTVPDGIYISDKVISLETLSKQLGEGKKLFISPKSILTPSAKDEIKKRNIEVAARITPQVSAEQETRELWIAELIPAALPRNIYNRLRKAFPLELKTFNTLETLLNEVQQKTTADSCGVLITAKSAVALQSANRFETIRAVSGTDTAHIAEDTQETNANVLVLRLDRIAEGKIFDVIKQFFSR